MERIRNLACSKKPTGATICLCTFCSSFFAGRAFQRPRSRIDSQNIEKVISTCKRRALTGIFRPFTFNKRILQNLPAVKSCYKRLYGLNRRQALGMPISNCFTWLQPDGNILATTGSSSSLEAFLTEDLALQAHSEIGGRGLDHSD